MEWTQVMRSERASREAPACVIVRELRVAGRLRDHKEADGAGTLDPLRLAYSRPLEQSKTRESLT